MLQATKSGGGGVWHVRRSNIVCYDIIVIYMAVFVVVFCVLIIEISWLETCFNLEIKSYARVLRNGR